MLPKVAGHILHHTSRAAAAAQNYALRNVLQQPSTSTGGVTAWSNAGSSSWGGYGTGAGGAKFNSGSRFYQGYTGAGRAVTQANSATAQDGTTGRTDDEEDFLPRRPVRLITARTRNRSNSLTLGPRGRNERAETLGALRTVQLSQARTKTSLAPLLATESTRNVVSEPVLPSAAKAVEDGTPSSPIRVRRNSTSAAHESEVSARDIPPPAPIASQQYQQSATETISADPAAPQTTAPPVPPPQEESFIVEETVKNMDLARFYDEASAAVLAGDSAFFDAAVDTLLSSQEKPNLAQYNTVLSGLIETRQPGASLDNILRVYRAAIERGLVPDFFTYRTVLTALLERDEEVHFAVQKLQLRIARRAIFHTSATDDNHRWINEAERNRIAQLRREDNFRHALRIFEALIFLQDKAIANSPRPFRRASIGIGTYVLLLRSCGFAGNIDAALRVFSQMEAEGVLPDPNCYAHIIRAYVQGDDIAGARAVFDGFRTAAQEGRLAWGEFHRNVHQKHVPPEQISRDGVVTVWVRMMEGYFKERQPVKAIALLEEMLDSTAGPEFGPKDVPQPTLYVGRTFIHGFINMGDIHSAVKWFDRMLVESTMHPDMATWSTILDGLVLQGEAGVKEYNRLFQIFDASKDDGIAVRGVDRMNVVRLNAMYMLKHPEMSAEEVSSTLDFVYKHGFVLDEQTKHDESELLLGGLSNMVAELARALVPHKRYNEAITALETYLTRYNKAGIMTEEPDSDADAEEEAKPKDHPSYITKALRHVVMDLAEPVVAREDVTLEMALRYMKVADAFATSVTYSVLPYVMNAYYKAKDSGTLGSLRYLSAETLLRVACQMELAKVKGDNKAHPVPPPAGFVFRGLIDYLADFVLWHPQLHRIRIRAIRSVAKALHAVYGPEESLRLLEPLGMAWLARVREAMGQLKLLDQFHEVQEDALENSLPPPAPSQQLEIESATPPPVDISNSFVDVYHGRYVDEYYPTNVRVTPEMAWERYEHGAAEGRYPSADVVGRLINTFGRLRRLDRVHKLYRDAQIVLALTEHDKQLQSYGWYTVEDQMIAALAHAGDVDGAHVHRQRILDQGGTPSADSYGGLIQCVKETTDDSANALALWQESQARGVIPNMYLYNTIISKLSRARKADLALELFQQMKSNHIRPSSVTFGAVIAACCRVGDAQSAEALFEEMKQQGNFRPRIPPYNTMIQFYTHIVRDRERALYYFGELLRAKIQPTAHTYKLLIDCYGTIEPVDTASMEDVFRRLVSDRTVQVQGVHWAAMINAYGCVLKDLDKAVEVFDSIESHPSTRRSGARLPDAVTYESMINVLVTLRRTDLIPEYLERLTSSGVHMTAYIVNLLIKGFAAGGDLQRAREIFESLVDPPVGVAAPNNHLPHDVSTQSSVAPWSPVYREPSTWEAMVRAELGAGNREQAMALLQRVQDRQFPPAVFRRISGIMLDESVSPWQTDSGSQSPF